MTCLDLIDRISTARNWFSILLVLALFLADVSSPAVAQEQRLWSSRNGKFKKQAVLIESKGDEVVLKLEDGSSINVPISSLSGADQEYIRSLADSSKESSGKEVDSIVDLRGAKLGEELADRIAEFHSGSEPSGEVLRVIYFHGSDSKPQAGYQSRLDGVMKDIQNFYYDQMKKNGFRSTQKMPLELENDRLIVHVVRGKNPSSGYSMRQESARAIRKECKLALRGKVDFETDYTLIFCGLVKKKGQQYIFSAPNYGLPGDHSKGCSFMPDSDKFDPRLLRQTQSKISYQQGSSKNKTESLAKYNSKRLGGTAHELGHALNLSHNGQTDSQRKRLGNALMGSGNYSYRKELWNKKSKGTFMTLASSLKLAAHPLFTGYDTKRWTVAKCDFENLEYSMNGRKFEIKGVVKSDPAPLAIIAYVDPAGGSAIRDYDSTTWVGGVGQDGSFNVTVEKHLPGTHELRLAVLTSNGAENITVTVQYEANRNGEPDLERLNTMHLVGFAEKFLAYGKEKRAAAAAKKLLDELNSSGANPAEGAIAQLSHIVALADPPQPQALHEVTSETVFLSDVQWESATVGLGQPARNRFFINPKKAAKSKAGALLQVGGKFHAKGLYAHANSSYVFDLDGKWTSFESIVGLQAGALGRVNFSVKGDGRNLYQSEELAGSEVEMVTLNVTGVKKLELIARPTTKVIGGAWTIWASPKLTR